MNTQLEETQKKNADNLERQREANKYEREEFEKIITDLKKKNSEYEFNINSLNTDLAQKDKQIKEYIDKLDKKEKEKEESEKKQDEKKENKEEYEKLIKLKDEEINNIKKQLEEKDKDIKKQLDEKDKKIQELISKSEKENNNYVKKIHDLTSQLNTSNLELNELKNKSTSVSLDQMLENPNLALEEQLDESKKTIEKLNEEIKYYEKQIENLKKDSAKAKKYDELEAKLKFCEDTIETMKNNNNELKEQKKKAQDDFENELEKVNLELSATKCELAKVNFDKDLIATESQKYINKLKNKMISLGFKFKTKKG